MIVASPRPASLAATVTPTPAASGAEAEWPISASNSTRMAPETHRSRRRRRQGRRERESAAATAPLVANASPALAHQGPVVRNCRVGKQVLPKCCKVEADAAQVDLQRERGQQPAGQGGGEDQGRPQPAGGSLWLGHRHPPMRPALGQWQMPGPRGPGIARTVGQASEPAARLSCGARPARRPCRRRCRRSRSLCRSSRPSGQCRSRACRRC